MPYQNKKVKNAKEVIIDGIKFKSELESKVYSHLRDKGITPAYETEEFIIQDKFRPFYRWFLNGNPQVTKSGKSNVVHDIKYTPDFVFNYLGYTIVLEVKGFPTDRYKIIRKLFLNYLNSRQDNLLFAEIRNIKELDNTLQQIKTITERDVFTADVSFP